MLGTLCVLMDFFPGTTLQDQLPNLRLAQQYATASVIISLLQRSSRSQLPASGQIQAASHMKDEGAPALWTRDQCYNVIATHSMFTDSDILECTTMTNTNLAHLSAPDAGRLPTLLQQLQRKLENWENSATDEDVMLFGEDCKTIHTILGFEKKASLPECTSTSMQSHSVMWHQDLA